MIASMSIPPRRRFGDAKIRIVQRATPFGNGMRSKARARFAALRHRLR